MPPILHYLTRALAAQKSAFAHVVVGNTAAHDVALWTQDIKLATDAGIDAFVLNIAYPDSNIPGQVANAFQAAEQLGSDFKLFFSFDYLGGGGPWPAAGDNSVVSYLQKYKDSPAHFKVDGKPMVSTFEGVNNVYDWAHGGPIRSSVGPIHFVPDWSSLGPQGIKAHLDKIEGGFSWNMWSDGDKDKTTESDLEWQAALGDKDYMMGVSPWFFRSAQNGMNWIWKSDDLWTRRWNQTIQVAPRFVQIVTWNDYGESHYIGPKPIASEIPAGSEEFVTTCPHSGWLALLPYHIAKYKGEDDFKFNIDKVTYWYRDTPASVGDSSWVVGNNPGHGQKTYDPKALVQDKIFISAVLLAPAQLVVTSGNGATQVYQGEEGFNHWTQDINDNLGVPTFALYRDNQLVNSTRGHEISSSSRITGGRTNFNAIVGSF